jgi:purine-binding chemotaxis protein CheW
VSGRSELVNGEHSQYLLFDVAEQMYAIPVGRVVEILSLPQLTRVPRLTENVRGLMNLRGTVLPVVDLSARFGFGPSRVTRHTTVVVVDVDADGSKTRIGFIADVVHDVVAFSQSGILPPPAFGTTIDVSFLRGMLKLGERFLFLMDVDRVLSVAEILGMHAEIDASGAAGTVEFRV